MRCWTIVCAALFTLCIASLGSAAAPIISLNGSLYTSVSASSSVNANYLPGNLFNHSSPVVGQEMQGAASDIGHAWAGNTSHSHYLEFQLDQPYFVESIYYAQRDFNNNHTSNFDKVTTMRIWARSSLPFATVDPGSSPNATINITNQTDDTFQEYALPNTISGRYFLLHVNNPNYAPEENHGVIGGSELRLGQYVAPEPSSAALVGMAALTLLGRRRK
jgi:hypothetical protein